MTQTLPTPPAAAENSGLSRARRPGKALTPDVVAGMLKALSLGLPIERAAPIVGISSRSWRYWQARGNEALDALLARDIDVLGDLPDDFRIPTFEQDAQARARGSEHPAWPAVIAVRNRPFVALVVETAQSFAQGELELVEKIIAAGDKDWKALQWILACTRPDPWAATAKVQISGNPESPVVVRGVAPEPANLTELAETLQASADAGVLPESVVAALPDLMRMFGDLGE